MMIGGVSDISIRQATRSDLNEVCTLVQDCIAHMRAHGIDQWDELYPDQGTLENDIDSQSAVVSVLKRTIVGMVVVNDHQDPTYAAVEWQFLDGPIAVVHRLMVGPAYQGRGLGRALMDYAQRRAYDSGFRAVRLDAFEANPTACAMYTRLGYRRAGQVEFRNGKFTCFEKIVDQGFAALES